MAGCSPAGISGDSPAGLDCATDFLRRIRLTALHAARLSLTSLARVRGLGRSEATYPLLAPPPGVWMDGRSAAGGAPGLGDRRRSVGARVVSALPRACDARAGPVAAGDGDRRRIR